MQEKGDQKAEQDKTEKKTEKAFCHARYDLSIKKLFYIARLFISWTY